MVAVLVFNPLMPGTIDAFVFDEISDPQTAGKEFSITIRAVDSNGNTVEDYDGTATLALTAGTGSITPTTANFSAGIATLNVTLDEAIDNQSITANDEANGAGGQSNFFDVNPQPDP